MDLVITNTGTKTIKSIDMNVQFPTNVSLTGYGEFNYKQLNSTTYSTSLTKSISAGDKAQMTALKTYPEAAPLIIVTNVGY